MSEEIKQSRVLMDAADNNGLPKKYIEQYDEATLIDAIKVLKKRKNVILALILFTTVAGSIYAFTSPEVYTYSTAIEVGALYVNGSEKPLAPVKNVASEIKELLIPSVLSQYYQDNPGQNKKMTITAAVPKDSEIIMLSSKSSEEDSAIYKQLLTTVSTKIITEQNKKVEQYKEQLTNQIINAKKRLELLSASAEETNKRIDNFQKSFKSSPIDNGGTTSLVITELFGQLQDISNEKFSLESLINNMEKDLKFTISSGVLSPVTRSLEAVSSDKKIIATGSFIVGIFLGVFVAFALDFIEKIKTELKATA